MRPAVNYSLLLSSCLWLVSCASPRAVQLLPPPVVVEPTPPVVPPVRSEPPPALQLILPPGFFPPRGTWEPLRAASVPLTLEGAKLQRVSSWKSGDLDPPLTDRGATPAMMRGLLTNVTGRNAYQFVDGEGRVLNVRFRNEDAVRPLSPGEANPWGLIRPNHLVELEVNHAAGGASSDGFVATEARLLENTTVFPLELESTLASLRERTRAAFDAKARAFNAKVLGGTVRAHRRVAPKETSGKGPPLPKPGIGDLESSTARWDERRQVLVVTTRRHHQEEHPGMERRQSSRCAPGQPCQERVIHPFARATTLMAVRQIVSAQGHLLEETTFEPITTVEEFER